MKKYINTDLYAKGSQANSQGFKCFDVSTNSGKKKFVKELGIGTVIEPKPKKFRKIPQDNESLNSLIWDIVKFYNEKGYLMFFSDSKNVDIIYTDKNTKYNTNPVVRLDIEKVKNKVQKISRDHDFQNKITAAYLYQNRVFVSFEKQTADPFEVRPAEKMKTAFLNEDWETLQMYAAE